ncbi:MAG: NAD(P)/FAD-dependent oxidoreductase [Gulosibacter sp.]|uniref:NAD(P)/FAD-dependent oxidoreductase n=1 Tax=Gulosibacter sp. TaxID=2817531 RepID=UPI003F8DFC28
MRVIVIGGGVIGLATAWSLARRGIEVEVVEANSIGESASAVNAGWITPSLSTPLASPGIISTGLKHAFDPNGVLRIRPQLDTSWLRWLMKFQRASRPDQYQAGVEALLRLNTNTLDLFDEMLDSGVNFEMHKAGLLALALKEGGLQWFRQLFDELTPLGFPGQINYLSPSEAREIEPTVGKNVVEVAHTTIDRHVHPDSLLHGLVRWLRDRGVTVHENRRVTNIERSGNRWSVSTTGGRMVGDRVVVALGAATNSVLKPLGVKLPLLGAKGYSITVKGEGIMPKHALYMMETKLGASPFHDGLRIAGVFDLPNETSSIEPKRIRAIVDQARPYIASWEPDAEVNVALGRSGLRPATANSLPFIGEIPEREGVYVAAGHGMLGVTLAPATGDVIADLIERRNVDSIARPFQLEGRV